MASSDADVVLDGTDNFATRYLINDACVKLGKPWVYCGVIASYGMTMTIRPGVTACLRCVMGELPVPGTVPTCDTAGVIGPIVSLMGSIAVTEALKLLVGRPPEHGMIYADLWDDSFDQFELGGPRPIARPAVCTAVPVRPRRPRPRTILCGRDACRSASTGARLRSICPRWRSGWAGRTVGTIQANPYLIRAQVDGYELTIFPDGRVIVKGTSDEAVTATLYPRYVGM